MTAQVGGGARLLVLEGKANSQAEAERKLQAAIDQANHGATTLQLSIPGNGRILAGQCINVNGLGNLSGKYFVDQVTHTIGDGYTMDLELSQVEEGGEAAVLDAINRLAMMGVLVSPEYWEQHWNDLPYLGGLLLNLSASIRTNNQGTAVTDMDQALDTLASRGVINTPEYWQNNHAAVPYLDTLLVSAANALE